MMRALVKTAIKTLNEKPPMATPNAVPLAGGCSKSTATIRKIDKPTIAEYIKMADIAHLWRINAPSVPQRYPTTWPPITLLGLAVPDVGMVKTMKAVEPMDAMITASSAERIQNTIKITRAAKRL